MYCKLNFCKEDIQGPVKNGNGDITGTLQSCPIWILNDEANLNLKHDAIFLCNAVTIENNIIYCLKSDRQMHCKPSCPSIAIRNYHTHCYITLE